MRLDKLLEQAKIGSRKHVKRLLVSKQVRVDGHVIMTGAYNVAATSQQVTVKGEKIAGPSHSYYMLNKPQGVVSAVTDGRHQTVIDLIAHEDRVPNLFPIGRLDRDTEGLLLLTDNGQLAYQLLLPSKQVVKRYEVFVNGLVTSEDQRLFQAGVVFHGGVQCAPAELKIVAASLTKSHVLLEIVEGKFHQVKKMFLVVGKKVTYLKRIKMATIKLDSALAVGEYRRLTTSELRLLQPYFNQKCQ